jgi:hypothetical protein
VEFEEIRSRLIHFYPDDVLRKKIAARAAVISQSGQYNLIRILRRNDPVAAMLTASRFTEAVISMIHLLERKYTPFYKWQMRSLEELSKTSPLARLTAYELRKLSKVCILPGEQAAEEAFSITETICRAIAGELRLQGFSYAESSFLQDHLEEIMSKIKNPEIRAMHPMADPAF